MENYQGIKMRPATHREKIYAEYQPEHLHPYCGFIGKLGIKICGSENSNEVIYQWNEDPGLPTRILNQFLPVFEEIVRFLFDSPASWADLLTEKSKHQNRYIHRIDVYGGFSYMVSFEPDKTLINLYVYERNTLGKHLTNTAYGIRFVDENYNEQFIMRDGGRVKIVETKTDTVMNETSCRYIDAYHTLVGGTVYHVCELAEKLHKSSLRIEPESKKELLPNQKFLYNSHSDKMTKIESRFRVGTRIRLIHMYNEIYSPMPKGLEGTVEGVDDFYGVLMRWDNGSHLTLLPFEDEYEILTP